MATLYSTEYTNSTATPPVKNHPSYSNGKVRVAQATYTQGASDAADAASTFYMFKLPAGATVLNGYLSWGTGNTNETLSVGIVGTVAKFCAATAAATASTGATACLAHLAAGAVYTTTAETDVIVTSAVAAVKAGQAITVSMFYVMD